MMLIDDYVVNGRKSVERARASVKQLREVFGSMRAMDLTGDRVGAYVRGRQESGAAAGTLVIQREIRDQPLQPAILVLELPQPARLIDLQPAVLGLPPVKAR